MLCELVQTPGGPRGRRLTAWIRLWLLFARTTTAILGLSFYMCSMVTGGIIMVDRWVSGGPDEVMQLKD